jgi:hypothetical protein
MYIRLNTYSDRGINQFMRIVIYIFCSYEYTNTYIYFCYIHIYIGVHKSWLKFPSMIVFDLNLHMHTYV